MSNKMISKFRILDIRLLVKVCGQQMTLKVTSMHNKDKILGVKKYIIMIFVL